MKDLNAITNEDKEILAIFKKAPSDVRSFLLDCLRNENWADLKMVAQNRSQSVCYEYPEQHIKRHNR